MQRSLACHHERAPQGVVYAARRLNRFRGDEEEERGPTSLLSTRGSTCFR